VTHATPRIAASSRAEALAGSRFSLLFERYLRALATPAREVLELRSATRRSAPEARGRVALGNCSTTNKGERA
jgi:hypothetical protein